MIEQEISNVAKETVEILNYFDTDFVSKISPNFINSLKELAQNSNIIVKIDKNKKLNEQNISEESKDLISLIYYNYIATKEKKKEILKIWNKNEELYQKNINEKYSIDNIFKKSNIKDFEQEDSKSLAIIQNQSYIQKIINFLKRIFNKN